MGFDQKIDEKWLSTYLNGKNGERFQYLVAAKNYTIVVDYKKQQKRIRLDIIGEDKGKDNKPFSNINSHCFPEKLKLV